MIANYWNISSQSCISVIPQAIYTIKSNINSAVTAIYVSFHTFHTVPCLYKYLSFSSTVSGSFSWTYFYPIISTFPSTHRSIHTISLFFILVSSTTGSLSILFRKSFMAAYLSRWFSLAFLLSLPPPLSFFLSPCSHILFLIHALDLDWDVIG